MRFPQGRDSAERACPARGSACFLIGFQHVETCRGTEAAAGALSAGLPLANRLGGLARYQEQVVAMNTSAARPSQPVSTGQRWAAAVYLLFFLSGMTSLIYEVVWGRKFGLVFGVTTYAVSTVLAAFFAGLALGSYIAGRLVDRTRIHPLAVYGVMEGVVGAYALLLPLLLAGVEASYPAVYSRVGESFSLFTLYRFVVCFVVLVVPTTLMGATLPVVSKLMVEQESVLGLNVGRLYAINTSGAVAGAFSAGFLLLKAFGVTNTTLITAAANFLLAAAALVLSRLAVFQPAGAGGAETYREGVTRTPATAASGHALEEKAILTLAFTSGLTVLALEVVWTRSLVLVLGSTTYAFSTMLTAVLVGIALGSAVFARWADPTRNRAALVGFLMFTGGLCAALGPGVINWLPFAFLRMGDWTGGNWALHIMVQFAICFALVFVPTFLSGASFPILVRMHSQGIARVGRTVADVYAVNTVGGILGSLAGGFVLVRFFGLERSLVAAALVLMVVGGPVAIAMARPWRKPARWAVGTSMVVVVVLLGFFHPRFNTKVLFSGWGPFGGGYYLGHGGGTTVDVTERYMDRLLYHKEGVSAAVDVLETGWGDKIISINAEPVATTYLYDMRALKMLGHLPVLVHPNPKEALLIGLGAGVSAGTIASYPSLDHVTVVELNEEVPDGTAEFADWNFDVVNNPKWKIVINDGANYVKATRKQYDIISSDPIHPFVLGNGILYSADHWKICRDRLKDGGVLAQWIPLYQLSADDFACIVRSFMEVFPNATMWYCGIDVVLIGAKGEFKIDPDRVAAHMSDPQMAGDLLSMGAHSVGDILGWFMAGPEQLREMSEGARINRVERPVLEYTAPQALQLSGVSATIPALLKAVGELSGEEGRLALQGLCSRRLDAQALLDATTMRQANMWIMRSQLLSSYDYSDQAVDACRNAFSLRPNDRFMREALADALVAVGDGQQVDGDYGPSLRTYGEAYALDPRSVSAVSSAVFSALQVAPGGLPALVQGRVPPAGQALLPETLQRASYQLPFVQVDPEEWGQLTPLEYAERIQAAAAPSQGDAFQMKVYRGLIALRKRDFRGARAAFEEAGAWGKDRPGEWSQESPTMQIGLGVLDLKERKPREVAYRRFDRGVAIATVRIDALYDIVDFSLSAGVEQDIRRYAQELVSDSTAAVAEDPGRPNFYRYRMLAETALGDHAAAKRDQETADSLGNWWE